MPNDENYVKLPGRIIIFIIALIFFVWGLFDINKILILRKTGIEAAAVVKTSVLQKNSDSADNYICTLEFGRFRVKHYSKNMLEPGKTLDVIYDPKNYNNYILGNKKLDSWDLISNNDMNISISIIAGFLIIFFGIFVPSESGGKWTPFWKTLKNELYFDRNKYWNILNPILGLPLILALVLVVFPASTGILKYFSGESTFLVLNKWTIYIYTILGLVVLLPFVFILVNCIEYLIPPAREAFEFDAKHKKGKGFGNANSELLSIFIKFGIFLLPVVIWAFLQYYTFDGKGIHDHRFPMSIKDYSWDDILMINLKAQDDESVQCSFVLKAGGVINIQKRFFTTIKNDTAVLKAFVKIRRQVGNSDKVKQYIDITPDIKETLDAIAENKNGSGIESAN